MQGLENTAPYKFFRERQSGRWGGINSKVRNEVRITKPFPACTLFIQQKLFIVRFGRTRRVLGQGTAACDYPDLYPINQPRQTLCPVKNPAAAILSGWPRLPRSVQEWRPSFSGPARRRRSNRPFERSAPTTASAWAR